jgi:hypothetical protein
MMGKAARLPPERQSSKPNLGAGAMPIYRLLRDHAFGPDEVKILGDAFEDALRTLRLVNRDDPATEIVAKKIIELAQRGERDPVRLREGAVQSVSP